MTETNPLESQRLATLAELAQQAIQPPTRAELERGLQELRARSRASSRRPMLIAALAAAVLSVAVIAGLALTWRGVATKPVAVERITGGKLLEGGYLAERDGSGIRLHFNEGSEFRLSPGTRGRLRELTPAGARFALDHGTAAFRITPNGRGQWWVEAGPFLVSVRGTDFSVGWQPTSERFEVHLRQGRVAVSGPVVGEELVLRPGQNLTVNLPKGETVISEAGTHAPAAAPSADTPAPNASVQARSVPSAKSPAPAAASPASSASASERGYREALATGQWDRILAEVEREGLDASVRTLSSDDLFALADAARYRRRTDVARAALLAQRARFPNSARSLDALFLLGRTEELAGGGRRAAIAHYDEYLSRAPAGTYAAEALGRKMILVKELEGRERARLVALDYLRRFPRGSYAEVARTLQ